MKKNGYLLGLDIGSSSIKAALCGIDSGRVVATATSPTSEMAILSERTGWAEQHPDTWWDNVVAAIGKIRERSGAGLGDVRAIGISYQMHGLVMVDQAHRPLAPSIIWCDSRAVATGEKAFHEIGKETCLTRLLNSPGNFTASKLKWVKDNRPDLYASIHRIMLPGDYIAMKLTGETVTTPSGLSEGILWDFAHHGLAHVVLEHYGIAKELVPGQVPTFSVQGQVTAAAAAELGLTKGIPVAYRAGDQPNNAFSLKALEPGEFAATAGTSGVIYGVSDAPFFDPECRVNTFAHVNYSPPAPRYGVLLCVNGTGILNRWLRAMLGNRSLTYDQMNEAARSAPPGCDGLAVLPYGNGAERTLGNRNVHATFTGLDFSRHGVPHLIRAAHEGIVFALRYGLDILAAGNVVPEVIRAGHANMFLSPLFAEVFATVCRAGLELYDTDGAQGAARGAGIGAGIYASATEAFSRLQVVRRIPPRQELYDAYDAAYGNWKAALTRHCQEK
ncbi:MAG: carbohydrate kinase [Chitinispirillaceae bacterium]|nr:carbohydrate kinase [Chitinispirillaceae bacterium]